MGVNWTVRNKSGRSCEKLGVGSEDLNGLNAKVDDPTIRQSYDFKVKCLMERKWTFLKFQSGRSKGIKLDVINLES